MKGKHGKKAGGGSVEKGVDAKAKDKAGMAYNAKGSPTMMEAEKRKKGGMCKKHGGKVDGEKSEKRLDRKPRASGGRTGAEMRPLSDANKVSNRPGGKMETENL